MNKNKVELKTIELFQSTHPRTLPFYLKYEKELLGFFQEHVQGIVHSVTADGTVRALHRPVITGRVTAADLLLRLFKDNAIQILKDAFPNVNTAGPGVIISPGSTAAVSVIIDAADGSYVFNLQIVNN